MGKTSSVKDVLFGETKPYTLLLEPITQQLIARYPEKAFVPIFNSLPHRSITTGPMAMCARLAEDLGVPVNDSLLQGIGTACLHISTHDDIIDEPVARRQQAARLYAGNISFIEASKLLLNNLQPDQVSFIWAQINRNHMLQQKCVEVLWQSQPKTFAQYRHGVEHDGALVGIGVCGALTAGNRQDLWPSLERVCTNYGVALQLLDDIAEVEEDKQSGYHSFPLFEGAPYGQSFKQIYQHLDQAKQALNPAWRHFGELFTRARNLARNVETKL